MRAALAWVFALLAFSVGVAAQAVQADPATRAEVLAAVDIMREARYATLVTIGEDGHPEARIVDPFYPEADLTIWIATHPRTRKVGEIKRDPVVTLLYFNASGLEYVTVVGSAELVSDPAEKARHWKQEWADYYKEGSRGPDYLLIRVIPTRLEVVSPNRGLFNDPDTWLPVIVNLQQ